MDKLHPSRLPLFVLSAVFAAYTVGWFTWHRRARAEMIAALHELRAHAPAMARRVQVVPQLVIGAVHIGLAASFAAMGHLIAGLLPKEPYLWPIVGVLLLFALAPMCVGGSLWCRAIASLLRD
jgi:hypothetical protein